MAVYEELRVLARRFLARERRNHTLQPTALVHEAWCRLRDQRQVDWNGRTQVLALGAQAMRRLLVDHGRTKKRSKRGGGEAVQALEQWTDVSAPPPMSVEDVLTLDAVLTRLAEVDERQASIVELRFFGGLTVPEVADMLGISTRTVEGEWAHARAWLRHQISQSS